jgi:undecaprenyl diphosphate synthase
MVEKELSIEVYGRVQGVGFRTSLAGISRKLGISGFVRNKEDEGVEIIAQGNKENLNKLLIWVNGSHVLSDINGLSYHWGEISKRINGFEVRAEEGVVVDKIKGFLNLGKNLLGKKEVENSLLHVAIIPDGNRRWARERGLDASFGHYKAGIIDNAIELFGEAKKLGIKYLSIWGFSTENWKRDENEINAIFSLLLRSIDKLRTLSHKEKIRFRHIGRKDRIPEKLMNALNQLENESAMYHNFNVQLCLDYGGRDEIIRTINKIISRGTRKVNEEMFKNELDTAGIPEPELIIRTSGEKRLSGLMPFQSVYSELYFVDKYFPDFKGEDLRKAVEEFNKRNRRFGGK